MIKLRAWIKPYKMMVEVQRINFDVQTIEVKIGDYIIKGVNGEVYPCKPDIFHKTYEKVE